MRKLKTIEINRLTLSEFKAARKLPLVVILDDVRSLYNVGSVFRTCDAFAVEAVCLCGITAQPPSAEIHKTALGAEDSVEWRYYPTAEAAVSHLHDRGYTVYAVEQCDGSMKAPLSELDSNGRYAVVLGNEVKGVHQSVIDLCDNCLEIPQFGTKHSMNVSVTAGIVIWEFARRLLLTLAVLLMPFGIADAQSADAADTVAAEATAVPEPFEYSFKASRLILPLSLTAVGALAIDNGFLVKEKKKLQESIQDLAGGHSTKIDDWLRYVPATVSLALPYLVSSTRLQTAERWTLRANAYLIMSCLVYGSKLLINETRPDASGNDAFPSGHTANTFLSAEIIRIEYGALYGAGAYAIACAVGFLRLYNNRHWVNDVLAGAGLGILSARIAYWMLPIERRLFSWMNGSRRAPDIVALPYYSPSGGHHLGAAMALRF